jgi:hypothetical protein
LPPTTQVGPWVLGFLVGGSFELRVRPARTKKRGSISASLREQGILPAPAKDVPHVESTRRVEYDLLEVTDEELVRDAERFLHAHRPKNHVVHELEDGRRRRSMRKSLTLNERQRVAGYMERAVKTMPPGASCLLANVFLLMVGLCLAWQKRRTTRKEREDYRFFYDVLNSNLGKGYYTTDRFQEGPTVYSDASRSSRYSGGGWCSSWGPFDFWRYGTAGWIAGWTICSSSSRPTSPRVHRRQAAALGSHHIQVRWRRLRARRSRDDPPLPEGAVGWCACTFCPLPVYPGEGAYCDLCWPVGCGCGCDCQCLCDAVDAPPRQRLGDALELLQVEVAVAATAPRTRTKRGHHGSCWANRRRIGARSCS